MGRLKDLSSIRYLGSIGYVLRPSLTSYSISTTDREMHKALIETVNNPPTLDTDQGEKQKWLTVMSITVYGPVATPHGAALGYMGRDVGGKVIN